jgi:predicted phosphodiesterase
MLLCAAGDIHGALDRLYDDVRAFEASLGARFDHLLHVGDFGIWPDPARVDRATRNHEGAGDFPRWIGERRAAPVPTLFIKGNHEDFDWLEGLVDGLALPGLRYLPNGERTTLPGGGVVVAGLGGCHGPSDYGRPAASLRGYARRHYTQDEVERTAALSEVDVLLLHDAPAGIEFVGRHPSGDERRYRSEAVGLAEVVSKVKPAVCFFGHHHRRIDAEIDGVPCVGMNLVGRPGNLVAFEVERGGAARVVGEWPPA